MTTVVTNSLQKSILREKAEKKVNKTTAIRDYVVKTAQADNRFDEFVMQPTVFRVTRTDKRYENAKLVLEMMHERATQLGVKPDFVVPGAADVSGDGVSLMLPCGAAE